MKSNLIIALSGQNIDELLSEVGNKSYSVNFMIREKVKTPKSFTITSEFFKKFIESSGISSDIKSVISRDQIDMKKKIKYLVYSTPFPKELVNILQEYSSQLENKVAVRSSFLYEDNANVSGAGQFTSFLNVKNSLSELENTIKKCWLSAWDNLTLGNNILKIETLQIPVLIQNYIQVMKKGVIFSKNPASHADETVIESSDLQNSVVEGGDKELSRYIIDNESLETKSENIVETSKLSYKECRSLIEVMEKLNKGIFVNGVDIEWGIDENGIVWFFQVRDITTNMETGPINNKHAYTFIDIDDKQILSKDTGKELSEFKISHWEKRRWIRIKARENGIRYLNTGFIFIYHTNFSLLEWKNTFSNFKTNHILLKVNKNSPLKTHVTTVEKLYNDIINNIVHPEVLCIQEFLVPEISGLSTKINDEYLIECIPGDVYGIFKSDLPFTTITFNANLEIISKNSLTYSNYWDFDINSMKPVKRFGGKEINLDIPYTLIKKLYYMISALSNEFGETRIEWMFKNNELYLYDLTFESKPLRLENKEGDSSLILSKGHAVGSTIVISEKILDTLKNKITKRRSVIPDPDEIEQFNSHDVEEIRKNVLEGVKGKPIIVAPYPDLNLCLFLKDAAAFIFERGAILSHMGIILREEKVPAVFFEKATSEIKPGMRLSINNNNISHITSGE